MARGFFWQLFQVVQIAPANTRGGAVAIEAVAAPAAGGVGAGSVDTVTGVAMTADSMAATGDGVMARHGSGGYGDRAPARGLGGQVFFPKMRCDLVSSRLSLGRLDAHPEQALEEEA